MPPAERRPPAGSPRPSAGGELDVERQIRHEKARTLGRAGDALDDACQRAWALWRRLEAGEAESLEAYRQARAAAAERRRILVLQREAVGLRSHADVERCYPLPPESPPRSDQVRDRPGR